MTSTMTAAQRAALLSTPDEADHLLIQANGNTLRGLERRGWCTDIVAFRDGTFAKLTPAGCAAALDAQSGE